MSYVVAIMNETEVEKTFGGFKTEAEAKTFAYEAIDDINDDLQNLGVPFAYRTASIMKLADPA